MLGHRNGFNNSTRRKSVDTVGFISKSVACEPLDSSVGSASFLERKLLLPAKELLACRSSFVLFCPLSRSGTKEGPSLARAEAKKEGSLLLSAGIWEV